MDQKVKDLAKELLVERIKAYMAGNPGNIVGTHVVDEWYGDCLALAEKIIDKTK